MNSNIWKDKDDIPKYWSGILFEYKLIGIEPEIGYLKNVRSTMNLQEWQQNRPIGITKWCYLSDLLSQSTRVEKLEKELKNTQAGLCCGHCNKYAENAKIWANKLAKLEKALDLAKEFIKDTLSPFVYKSLLEEITQPLEKLEEINTITKGDNDE